MLHSTLRNLQNVLRIAFFFFPRSFFLLPSCMKHVLLQKNEIYMCRMFLRMNINGSKQKWVKHCVCVCERGVVSQSKDSAFWLFLRTSNIPSVTNLDFLWLFILFLMHPLGMVGRNVNYGNLKGSNNMIFLQLFVRKTERLRVTMKKADYSWQIIEFFFVY